jgi:hypothetical protein
LKSIASEITNSPEADTDRIQSAFQEYLGQDGTAEEVHGVLAQAAATHTSLRAAILGSSEFYAQSGRTLSGYQAALETDVLGTTVDQPVLKAQLASGVSRTVVAEEVLESEQGKQSLLVASDDMVLDGTPGDQQIATDVALMNDGVYLRNIIASQLAGSEFFGIATASIASSSN